MNWGLRLDLKKIKSITLLGIVGLLLYMPFVGSPFLLDDQSKIVNNQDIRSLKEIFPKLVYPYSQYQFLNRNDPSRPLTFLTYAVNYAISKDQPWSYHLFDFLVHIANSVLVLLISARLLGFLPTPSRASGSLIVALLFLLHPLNGGTVIYAYGRSDVLSSFFMLVALALALREGRAKIGLLALVYALALMTKQSSIVLPLGVLGIMLLRDPVDRVEVRRLMTPLVIVSALYIGFRLYYFKALGDLESFGGAWRPLEYLSVQPLILARYMETLIIPLGQTIDHFIIPTNTPPAARLWGLARWLGYNALLYWGWRKTGRRPVVLFGIAFYYLLLLPTSSILPTVDAMVERRTYLANFGLLLALVGMFAARFGFRRRSLATAGACVLLALLGLRTAHRNQKFLDPIEVWKEAIENYPSSPRAINNAAILYMDRQDFATAHNLLGFLVHTYDRDPFAHLNFANLLAMETQYKDDTAAERLYRKAISLKGDLFDS